MLERLVQIIKKLNSNFLPLDAGVEPKLAKLTAIKAIVFDVYGTMCLSGVGDISLAETSDTSASIGSALAKNGFPLKEGCDDLSELFHEEIKRQHQQLKLNGIQYPEVEIRDVWRSLIWTLAKRGLIDESKEPVEHQIEAIAVSYECYVNKVWPEPTLKDSIQELKEQGYTLGIISNAQFFTPILFEALLDQNIEALGFDPACCIWSYKLKEAKPSVHLFNCAAMALEKEGIEPSEILYIGNDMRNDIWPASLAGFKTGLYAGDKRSLRLREDSAEVAGITPDIIITELSQILDCIS